MKGFLVGLVIVAALVVGIGLYQGWFKFEKTQTDDGKIHVGVGVDKEKFKQDKEALAAKFKKDKETLASQFKKDMGTVKEKLAALKEKVKGLTGDAKAKAEKEADELQKKHDAFEAKSKELEGVAEDKFEEFKKGASKLLEEPADKKDKE
jgi:hypothetical protein